LLSIKGAEKTVPQSGHFSFVPLPTSATIPTTATTMITVATAMITPMSNAIGGPDRRLGITDFWAGR
jgi:hypothetical protein